ncbi:unnamed protein product [Calypogeia fissa]
MAKKKQSMQPLKAENTPVKAESVRRSKRKDPPMQKRVLRLVYPKEPSNREKLKKKLEEMGCAPLLDLPWLFLNEEFVKEVISNSPPVQFPNNIRAAPSTWTTNLISQALGLSLEGEGFTNRSENLTSPCFKGMISGKEGWKLSQCSDQDLYRVMAFLLPLLYPEKSMRVTVSVGGTIIASYIGQKVISWPKILEDVISKQVMGLTLKTPTSLACYLCHLYFAMNVMFKEDRSKYHTKKYMLQFGDPNVDKTDFSDEEEEKEDEEIKIVGPLARQRLHPANGQGLDSDPSPASTSGSSASPFDSAMGNFSKMENLMDLTKTKILTIEAMIVQLSDF